MHHQKNEKISPLNRHNHLRQSLDALPLPSDERITELAHLIHASQQHEVIRNRYAAVSRILAMVGAGVVLSLSIFVAPTAIMLAKPFLDQKRRRDQEAWKQFSPRYLRRTITRLRKEKLVTVEERSGETVVTLTKNGKRRILKYSLETLAIDTPRTWDGRWRLAIYDIPKKKKRLRDLFRQTIQNLGFYQLQESVWLYPYPCEREIAFLREYYSIGSEVVYIVASKLEDDSPYRTYFSLS